ncbi:Pre-mRNA cleavage complex II protein Clp1-domain-containing protein [Triangularia verruculosa]|uniref:Polynucleotide 5'-hydroxyl-kinase GRC3 n=1 Tax=Triangularia verruculosa TaxID=2587418 RepID=A0AAN7ATW4_9PEZI|nr:Pre-mRNA cleavage complex II protein Clp1-domain-containing protein [Triangularia verruculosa]
MSIPGLGQITAQQSSAPATRTVALHPFSEWRFQISPASTAACRLVAGTAERDGTELAQNKTYSLTRCRSKIVSFTGATLEVSGEFESENVKHSPTPAASPFVAYLNLHFLLQARRTQASQGGNGQGPRVMICGPAATGKSSLAKMLIGWATRQNEQPVLATVDPRDGMLALPGTLSAAVFATVMDVEDPEGGVGVGCTPSSGPSAVPVKLPVGYYFGREKVEDDEQLWKDLVRRLGSSVRAKTGGDQGVRRGGVVIDTPAVDFKKGEVKVKNEDGQQQVEQGGGVEGLMHVVREFAVNIIVVLGSPDLEAELRSRNNKSTLGEPIEIVNLDKPDGVVEQDRQYLLSSRKALIKDYFFGDSKRALSPSVQSFSFDDVVIFRAVDGLDLDDPPQVLERAEITEEMSHWTLAVMDASVNDPLETIRQAPVIGWVCVSDVDKDRRRMKILSPVSGRLTRPMVWGRWPEPYVNLLG